MAAPSVLTHPWVPTPSDGLVTDTLTTQHETEKTISELLTTHMSSFTPPVLERSQHMDYLLGVFTHPLPAGYVALDASRPWLLYWTLHSLALLDGELDADASDRVINTLGACQNPEGGFGGGPGQMSHLAPSYAAVSSLAYTGQKGWESIDRKGMYNFLMSVKQPDGSFIMHKGGEVDVRGCYCALTVATLLNILTPDLVRNTANFLASCQTYEGGLASTAHTFLSSAASAPLGEAHGGYAFCAVASWAMVRSIESERVENTGGKKLDLRGLMRWATACQAMPIEGGGFRGRTNKLVDGCYSWWGGGIFGVLTGLIGEEEGDDVSRIEVFDRRALQEYVLLAAQSPGGGLRDKPGKRPDGYHTCYNLCGLSSAQHSFALPELAIEALGNGFVSPFDNRVVEIVDGEDDKKVIEPILGEGEDEAAAEKRMREIWSRTLGWTERGEKIIVGDDENEVIATHPVLNLTEKNVRGMMGYFYGQV